MVDLAPTYNMKKKKTNKKQKRKKVERKKMKMSISKMYQFQKVLMWTVLI